MRYRRAKAKGATFFFTVVTYKRKRILCHKENAALIKEAFNYIMEKHPSIIDAFIMLPDHIHCIWTLPEGDNDYPQRWRQIKAYFTRNCSEKYKGICTDSMKKRHAQAVWQRRFWEHQIRDDRDFAAHADYIHYNPVKHGLVNAPKDWEHSTFHRYVQAGVYDINWGTAEAMRFNSNVKTSARPSLRGTLVTKQSHNLLILLKARLPRFARNDRNDTFFKAMQRSYVGKE